MKKKILVIEPDLFLSGLICEFIEIGGFEAEDVDYCEVGWERALSGGYDLVLLDLSWALLNGRQPDWHLGKLMRTPSILLAGPAEIEKYYFGGQLEAVNLLAKPFTFMELMLKTKEFLNSVKSRRNPSTPPRYLTRIEYPPPIHQREAELLAVENGA